MYTYDQEIKPFLKEYSSFSKKCSKSFKGAPLERITLFAAFKKDCADHQILHMLQDIGDILANKPWKE